MDENVGEQMGIGSMNIENACSKPNYVTFFVTVFPLMGSGISVTFDVWYSRFNDERD